MKQRTKTAIIIIAVVLVALASRLLYVGLFDIFVGFVAITGCIEICKMFESSGRRHCSFVASLYPVTFYVDFIICKLTGATVFWHCMTQLILFVALLLLSLLLEVKAGFKPALRYMFNTLKIMVYPGLFFCSLFVINNIEILIGLEMSYAQLSFTMLALVLLISSFTDTFAWAFGSLIRGPKLAPKISPNKSISGALFGLLGGVLAGLFTYGLCSVISPFNDVVIVQLGLNIWHFVLFGFIGSIIGQIGDLFESFIKRRCGVKDSGNIFPGHGGMMDRVDSEIANAVAVLVCFLIIL